MGKAKNQHHISLEKISFVARREMGIFQSQAEKNHHKFSTG
jgi:hypothetical protein